jgi:hypothetical protein
MSSTLVVPENVGVASRVVLSFGGLEMLRAGAAMLAGANTKTITPTKQPTTTALRIQREPRSNTFVARSITLIPRGTALV